MSLHRKMVEFVARVDATPRKEGHTKLIMCPACTHDVKAINGRKHVTSAHPRYAGALQCVSQASDPRKLLATAN